MVKDEQLRSLVEENIKGETRTRLGGHLEEQQTEDELEVRIHCHGCSPLLGVVLDVCQTEMKEASASHRMRGTAIERKELELTLVRELLQRVLRRLDLLVGVSSDLVISEVGRDLDDPIGVEDDLLTSGGDVVEDLRKSRNEMSFRERRREGERTANGPR